jgi:hypothetical protein
MIVLYCRRRITAGKARCLSVRQIVQYDWIDIAMTLSWTRPYPDPTRCRVGSDPSRVPVGSSWAGSMGPLVGSGYPAGSGK